MPRVIAYVRVSTNKQDVENQLSGIRIFADRERIEITETVGETISGYKSTLTERKLSEVLEGLERGDILVVSESSRISRRLLDVQNTIHDLLDRGIGVVAVKENIVFKDDINSKVLAFAFGLSAEIERNLISARTREALARKKAEGMILGRPVGSGKVENLKLYGKDEQILELQLKRVSKSAIARMFDVNRETLNRYIKRQNLDRELLWRRHNKTTN
ncbi:MULTISPECIES: recombinase family protein [unclassified Rhodococcus (in: high G+C Gram-positive bacteria)]|uniref:recombinase family protein n=1 Tax=unclassified Rhodococcus (in: high G+C Gram-positive bacteria) TaxID=192944 RepID=UPI0024B82DE5|nr:MULTISPECIES: recombinase family protein [unclassified Rhodococcus (in: high G+C Gram-positive bacteria)]MDI9960695.1 recombinase family protein [Rhodococcus sp. IEGM 1237]MDI9966677.1 recombinase family protein [Rhodococcus sp. IEGM 1251]MDV8129145.1 recombinase family protein [Rhodococcus sp. IEGM 1304]